jgi:hypothetical protein
MDKFDICFAGVILLILLSLFSVGGYSSYKTAECRLAAITAHYAAADIYPICH